MRPSISWPFHDPYGQEKEKALYAFLAGALCVAAYGFFQYADAHDMAKDLTAQSWVDPSVSRFSAAACIRRWRIRTFWALTF